MIKYEIIYFSWSPVGFSYASEQSEKWGWMFFPKTLVLSYLSRTKIEATSIIYILGDPRDLPLQLTGTILFMKNIIGG